MGIQNTGNQLPSGAPALSAPYNLSQLSDAELEQRAQQIQQSGSPYELSEIVDQLTYLRDHGIELSQSRIENLHSGQPVLSHAEIHDVAVNELESLIQTNPWLNANPYATFTLLLLELAALLSRIKVTEGDAAADAIEGQLEISQDIADTIIAIGQVEATAHYVQGALSIAGGAVSVGGALGGQSWAIGGQGVSAALQGIGSFVQGWAATKKAGLEGYKTLAENALRAQERELNAALEGINVNNDLLSQTLQLLQKIIDEAYRAHGWSVR